MTTVPQYVTPQNKQPHPRIAIRNWIKLLLKQNTDMVDRWFCSRPDPAFLEEVPVGLIYFTDEPADHEGTAPRNYKRDLNLTTQVLHRMDSIRENEMDDWMDSRAYEIEIAMLSDRFLGQKGLIQDTVLLRTKPSEVKVEGVDSLVSSIELFWQITYRTGFSSNQALNELFSFLNTIQGTQGEDAIDDVQIRTS